MLFWGMSFASGAIVRSDAGAVNEAGILSDATQLPISTAVLKDNDQSPLFKAQLTTVGGNIVAERDSTSERNSTKNSHQNLNPIAEQHLWASGGGGLKKVKLLKK